MRLPDAGLFTGLTEPGLSVGVGADRLLEGDGPRSMRSVGRKARLSPLLGADFVASGLRNTLKRLARRPSTLPRLSLRPLCAERMEADDGSGVGDCCLDSFL